jgi:hypothetical protein
MKSYYQPSTRKIILAPDATAYAKFHELAHKEQHDTMALVFRAWFILRWFKVTNYFATLWIEWDAHCRARAAMMKLGLWNDEARQEGRSNLKSYAMCKES